MILLCAAALASTASPPPPAPPRVDFGAVPKSAAVRPTNNDGKPHAVLARLITDSKSVQPGGTFRLGLHLAQDDGWHTYWRSPGDIGLPTTIRWTLPDGATATPYVYPVPQRFDVEDIVSFGYDHEVLLYTEVTVPASAKPGKVTLGAKADWLACRETCIPGEVELKLPFEVAGATEPNGFAPLFDHYEKQHPVKDVPGLTIEPVLSHDGVKANAPFKVAFLVSGDGVEMSTDALWPGFTPIAPESHWGMVAYGEDGSKQLGLKKANGTYVAHMGAETFDRPEGETVVGGLFQLKVGGKPVATEVVVPLAWKADDAALVESTHAVWKDLSAAPVAAVKAADDLAPEPPVDEVGDPDLSPADCDAMLGAADAKADAGLLTTLWMLGMAFVGGLILNVMPCVLPVLTLKLYSLIEQADIGDGERRRAGLSYTAGIVASFLALAAMVLVMQLVLGQNIGWGFQFQYPPYVAALATIVFVFGLSLFGVFEIPAIGADSAAQASDREGMVGYFMTGVFATLLATPCSAPFLGTAIGFAFAQPPAIVVLFFAVAGLGLAAPFLLIAFVPALFRLMPQPGEWMDTFKHVMGFTLMATTIWLVGVLATQITLDGLMGFIAFLATAALGAWIFGRWGGLGATLAAQGGAFAVALIVSVLGGFYWLDMTAASYNGGIVDGWRPFTESTRAALLNRYRGQPDSIYTGRPVFLDFTAEWCLSCKVNEKTVLASSTVESAFEENHVVKVKVDWTNRDEAVTDWLKCFGAGGVPYYAVVPPDGTPVIRLGEVVTPGGVEQAVKGASQAAVGKL